MVRNSLYGRRLIEDGETFEEYKERQRYMDAYKKIMKKGFYEYVSSYVKDNKLFVKPPYRKPKNERNKVPSL